MTHKINLLARIKQSQCRTGFGLGGLWLISQCFPNMEACKRTFFLFFFVLMWFVVCCWLTPSCEQIMTWRCIPLPWRQVAYIVCLSSANTNSSWFMLSQTLNEASPVSPLRFPKTTNDSRLAEVIMGEMVIGGLLDFSFLHGAKLEFRLCTLRPDATINQGASLLSPRTFGALWHISICKSDALLLSRSPQTFHRGLWRAPRLTRAQKRCSAFVANSCSSNRQHPLGKRNTF